MTRRLHQAMREHFAEFRFAAFGGKSTAWVFHHSVSRKRFYDAGDRLKDLRTSYETGNTSAVLDGDLDGFMQAELERGLSEEPVAS